MDVIWHNLETQNNPIAFSAGAVQCLDQQVAHSAAQHTATILRHHHHMVIQIVVRVPRYSLECHMHMVAHERPIVEWCCDTGVSYAPSAEPYIPALKMRGITVLFITKPSLTTSRQTLLSYPPITASASVQTQADGFLAQNVVQSTHKESEG